jgi:voltage-gated potassium channel
MFAGIVGQTLMTSVLTIRQEQFRMRSTVNHMVLCGLGPGNSMLLDALSRELDLELQPVVVFSEGARPHDLPPEFRFVSGDPTKESELEKARIRHAGVVIVAGSPRSAPQQADATTILTCFTLRRYLRAHPLDQQRSKPLYIVAEILDAENVEHAKRAGADEVIESTLVGFSLVAHAVRYPGTAATMSGLAQPQGHNLYVGPIPKALELPMDFQSLAAELKASRGVLAIGIRCSRMGHDIVNPPDARPVIEGDMVLYLAVSPVLEQR